MVVGGRGEWRSPCNKDRDAFPWDITRLDGVMEQAMAPKATVEMRLWCAKLIARCVEMAGPNEQAELRQRRLLMPTLQHLFSQTVPTLSAAKLRQHVLSVHLHLLGGDAAFDELLVMDVGTVNELVTALSDETHPEVKYAALLVVRRISELPHVSSILVFEESLFDVLQDLLETIHVAPRVALHIFQLFVNLSGHSKLHFKLARSRRVVSAAIDTLLCVLESDVVKRATRRVRRVLKVTATSHESLHTTRGISTHAASALEHMSMTVPSAMIIANLLSFPDNRASMPCLYPDLVRALELCDSQDVSIRLRKVARRATDFLHENDTVVEAQLLAHLGSSKGDCSHH